MLKNSWVNEHDSKKRLNYTYTNKHYSSLNDRDFYLLTILRNNDDKLMELKNSIADLKRINNQGKLLIIESYGSLSQIFKSYFSSLKNKDLDTGNTLEKNGLAYCSNLIKFHYKWVDYPKNKYFEIILNSYLNKNINIKNILIPLFEFIEGRIVLKTFNERHINTLALQQGAVSNFHLEIYLSNCIFDSLDNNYVPNKFLVNGLLEKNYLKR